MGRGKGAAAVLKTSPAYSFGSGSHESKYEDDNGPGPGAYNVRTAGSQHSNLAKGGGFGSGRLAPYGNDNPAPGEYNVSLKATHKSSRETLVRGRESPDPLKQQRQPGPGHYRDVPPSATHPESPSVSISHRLEGSKEAERKPAPGEYNPDNYRSKSPLPVTIKHKRGTAATDKPDSGHAVPGPGEYRPQDVTVNSRHSPAHTMGGSRQSASVDNGLPGPADYSPYLEKPRGAASFGKAERQQASQYEVRPPPGAYFTQNVIERQAGHSVDSLRRSAPAITMGVRDPGGFSSSTPGPSDYGVPKDSIVRASSPSYTFKGVNAKDHLAKNPGPGYYNPDRQTEANSVHSSAPAVSISHRHPEPHSQDRKPAPGEYDPDKYRSKSPLAVTMKHKRGLAASDRPDSGHAVPGPGEYQLASTLAGPAVTIGIKLNNDSKYKQQMPGPGEYDVHESTLGVAGRS